MCASKVLIPRWVLAWVLWVYWWCSCVVLVPFTDQINALSGKVDTYSTRLFLPSADAGAGAGAGAGASNTRHRSSERRDLQDGTGRTPREPCANDVECGGRVGNGGVPRWRGKLEG